MRFLALKHAAAGKALRNVRSAMRCGQATRQSAQRRQAEWLFEAPRVEVAEMAMADDEP